MSLVFDERRPRPKQAPAPAASEVHWHIGRVVVDADLLGGVEAGALASALNAALNAALTQRLAGASAATPPRGEAPWVGAVAEALVARLPPTSSGTQPR